LTEGRGLSIGYFAQQELDVLNPSDNPLEHMIGLVKKLTSENRLSGQATREQDLRGFLGMFNFGGDMIFQRVGSMSGGEKARLVLCMIVWQRPNLLLLDEPTNHLDLATREALAMALNEFEGTVMLVSHDRALLRSVCDEFWMVSKGGIKPFDGDLEDYQRYLLEEAKLARENAKQLSLTGIIQNEISNKSLAKPAQATPSDQKKLVRQLEQLEEKMAKLKQKEHQLQELLVLQTHLDEITQTSTLIGNATSELAKIEEQWLTLSEQLEQQV
jgi:ATP-binding cassette subfamily F protein 3